MVPIGRASCSSIGRPARRGAGFTLIELLVVISILALLMGFIIPAFFGTKDKGNIARAKAEAKQLETAWKQFFLTYNRWPDSVGDGSPVIMYGPIVQELGGLGGSVNTRSITFFDVPATTNMSFHILDPWLQYYKVLFDHDFNTRIDLPAEAGGGTVPRTVVVYTIFVSSANKTNIIRSWD